MSPAPDRPLLAILGPTASGKTSLSIELALENNGEIVNCDSLLVYRGFDIGTAKPTAAERRCVPHHLIDILEPGDIFNAGEFARLASAAIQEISGRGRLPILAGGTGFYLRALLEGLAPGPERAPELRALLSERAAARPGVLHRFLRQLDPATAARIHPNDFNKTLRAVEICLLSGRAASQLFATEPQGLAGYRTLKIALNPDRAGLHSAIEARSRQIWNTGLAAEVRSLLDAGVPPTAKPFESLGYKEALAFLDGRLTLEEAIERTTIETRQYAKRQMTWFRRDREIHWLNGFGPEETIRSAARGLVTAFLCEFTFMNSH